MKIFSANQIKELDKLTCELQGITSYDLMERAAGKCYQYITSELEAKNYIIFCGMGNNGGDGLAIARMLFERGEDVTVMVVRSRETFSENANINFERYKMMDAKHHSIRIDSDLELTDNLINKDTIIIDAIFGIGLKGLFDKLSTSVIDKINNLRPKIKKIVSIDTPSGICFESKIELHESFDKNCASNSKVQSDVVLTFQTPKLPLLFPENGNTFQKMEILDIALEYSEYLKIQSSEDQNVENSCYYDSHLSFPLPIRKRLAHKGNNGHALMIAGSYGKMGAAVLATKALLCSGIGLATAHIPKCGYNIMQIAVPDAMVNTDKNNDNITSLPDNLKPYSIIAFGPGVGTNSSTTKTLLQLLKALKTNHLKSSETRLVLDADAINILAKNPKMVEYLPPQTILTPHFKELERLIGVATTETHHLRLSKTQAFCIKHNVVMVVKGANTAIVNHKGEIYFNSTGNQGLATAGTGDVLTGIISAIYASGTDATTAAVWGCYLHGMAADFMANEMGFESITAPKLIEYLGIAFKMSEEIRQ